MKKIVCFLVALLFVPIVANADVAMPDFKTFDVVVVKDSIPYYEEYSVSKVGGTIPKGTELTVQRRFIQEGVEYGEVLYKKNSVYISLEDVFISGELGKDAKDVIKLDKEHRLLVPGETVVRKGPVTSYETCFLTSAYVESNAVISELESSFSATSLPFMYNL